MYNYDFSLEKVNYENNNVLVSINDKEVFLSLLITNKNILLFDNVTKYNVRSGREQFFNPNYELVHKIPINTLKYETEDNNTIINDIVLYDINIGELL